jgi:dynactin complex subunit
MAEPHHVGQRISYNGALCTVRYVGEVAGTSGTWLGVEWDDGTRGKHDGSHKGVRYFSCM